MLAFLPAVTIVLLVLSLRLRSKELCWREIFVDVSIFLGLLTVFVTEALSLGHLVTFPAILCFWTAVTLSAGGLLYWRVKKSRDGFRDCFRFRGQTLSPFTKALLGCVVLYVLSTGLIAVLAPPNTGDTFEYHMPKVMQWVQNHSIAFFPTAVPRQNHLAPGAEYAVLHLQLLSGSDRFANLVDWMSMIGSVVAVSLIARRLGGNTRAQMLSAIFAATLPMGIMQASSTQTDYVVAFWFTCFVYYAVQFREDASYSRRALIGLSASLGLAVFTKATAYLLAPAFLLWLALSRVKADRRKVFRDIVVFTVIFLSINAGHYLRNWELYRNPLGSGQEPAENTRYSLEAHSPKLLLSNFSKHVATHLGTPWKNVNGAIANFYLKSHEKMGIDVNDTRISWGTGSVNRFGVRRLNYADEVDGNPLHFLLALLSAALLFSPALRNDRLLLKYAAAITGGALLFVFYLKWHPWMSRLHLPLFVLAAPLVAVVLAKVWNAKLVSAMSVVLVLLGIPWILFCQQRPMAGPENIFSTPRDRLYLMTRRLRTIEPSFLNGKALLESRDASRVGLIVSNSSIEYWWWAALTRDRPDVRFQHVNFDEPSVSISAEKPFSEFQPDAVLALDQEQLAPQITVGQRLYARLWQERRAAIYFPVPDVQ